MVDSARKKLKILKIILWCILGAILLFIFVVLGTLLVQKYIKKSPVPMFAGYGYMIVETGSMSTTINAGDLIIVKKPGELNLGDIVTFKNKDGEIITHRIVNYYYGDTSRFATAGDYTGDWDPDPLTADQVYAVHVITIPKVGLVFRWITQEYGFIYIIALIAVVVAGVFFWNTTKSDSDKKEENATSSPKANADNPTGLSKDGEQPKEEQSQNNNQ